MKFAVLEYTSKSGDIWRHTDERPNYLADPQAEIDPTSFGCYVSALKGEHIPLTKLINSHKITNRIYRKFTGHWPINYSLEYLQQFDLILAVHQISDTHEFINALSRLNQLNPRPVVIGVPTQPYGVLLEKINVDPTIQTKLVQFIKLCDIFVSVVQDTVSWYEEIAQTKITYLPQPYPVDYAGTFSQSRSNKTKTILVAGITQRPNITQGHIVARALQQKFPNFKIILPHVSGYDYDVSHLTDANYEFLPFEPWQNHLKTLATTSLVINTDYTKTRGRVQTDCAATLTPSLGGNSDGSLDLFPALASTPATSNEELVKLGTRLLTDPNFYDQTTAHARTKLEKYNYHQSATRLIKLTNHG